MNAKSKVKLGTVLLLILTAYLLSLLTIQLSTSHGAHAFDFDLNEPADEEPVASPPDTTGHSMKPAAETVAVTGRDPKSNKEKVRQIYAKIERLFKILKVCDTENFDLSKLDIPLNFSSENKAMMALNAVGKSKLITSNKNLQERFHNILGNCRQLAKAVQEKDEEINGRHSQMSGEEYDEMIARRKYELRNAPFEDIRRRFLNHPSRGVKMTIDKTTTTTTTEKPGQLGITVETVEHGNGAPRKVFEFFL